MGHKHALNISPYAKRYLLFFIDLFVLFVCLFLAMSTRLSTFWWPDKSTPIVTWFGPLLSSAFLYAFSLYETVVRIYSRRIEKLVFQAQTLAALVWGFSLMVFGSQGFPRSVVFIYWAYSTLAIILSRQIAAYILSGTLPLPFRDQDKNVLIFGAGKEGAQLAENLLADGSLRPIAFIDDDQQFVGRRIAGLKVFDLKDLPTLTETQAFKFVLFHKPDLPRRKRISIIETLTKHGLDVRVVPGLRELASGKATIQDIRSFTLEDLLGRPMIKPRQDLLDKAVKGKNILITGAGGSIGSEIVRQALHNNPKELLLLDNCEYNLFKIRREVEDFISKSSKNIKIYPLLGSVADMEYMDHIFQKYEIDIVFHAAAYKHVQIVEENPGQAIINNIIGTYNVGIAACKASCERVVLVSTDKAVRPTSVMGASKRITEYVITALQEKYSNTILCGVRFGNVLGSSGSVVPIFRKQIANGGPVTVTHPDVTRYFMLIPEAAQLVIQAGAMARGGEIFLLDMGEPIKILDLAKTMIRLSGLSPRDENNPDGDIEIIFTGLKKGEKLHEELFISDYIERTEHPQILLCNEPKVGWDDLIFIINTLRKLYPHERAEKTAEIIKMFASSTESIDKGKIYETDF